MVTVWNVETAMMTQCSPNNAKESNVIDNNVGGPSDAKRTPIWSVSTARTIYNRY